jgi:curved DNA-binding protein CbpA
MVNMKRINEYKKIFNIEGAIDLKELKNTYRGLIKEWHPDKFQDKEQMDEAGIKSQKIIEAYNFLVSIAPETIKANSEEYLLSTSQSRIEDFQHKGLLLEISFADGTTYEYFGVDKRVYNKLINSDNQYRFAKRSIFNSFLYRKSKKDAVVA